jgi:integrase
MDEISLFELIEQTRESIRSFKYKPSTIYRYEQAWSGLTRYFLENHQVMFSKQLAEQYILEAKAKLDAGSIKRWQYRGIRQKVQMLIEYYENGRITWKRYTDDNPSHLQQLAFLLLHKDYLDQLNQEGKSATTIENYGGISRQLLEFLEQQKFKDISEVRPQDINLFLPVISKRYQTTNSMADVLTALRSFLRFVELKKRTTFCLSGAIPSSCRRKTTIVSTITYEEEQKLLDAVDRQTPEGKRNYAMLLLALRTGLRSIDIANLKMGNIHWKSNTIEIIQEKTETPLVLPLLPDVGNAIADYILNGRPDSQEPYLFLRAQAPYRKLYAHSACYGVSRRIMKAAGIRQGKNDRKGFHCLRHSVATRLLEKEIPLPIISSILGHRDKESTKVYLSADLIHLRTCALDLKGIETTNEDLL